MNTELPKTKQFPKIPRFITEKIYSPRNAHIYKISVISFFSGIMLIGIVLQANILFQNIKIAKKVVKEREQVIGQVVYWKTVSEAHAGNRDIYYRIATLQYKLGNVEQSREYIRKALELDPNFDEAKVLGAKVGLTLP